MMKQLTLAFILIALGGEMTAWQVTPEKRGFRLETGHLQTTVRNGMIVELRDRKTGSSYGNGKTADFPGGIGILRDLTLFRRGHMPWGEPTMKQDLPPDFPLTNYFRPCEQSEFQLKPSATQVIATWRGLSNGKEFLPNAELTMIFSEDENGALNGRITGAYPGGGVFGAVMPLAHLTTTGQVIVPGFGGIAYPAEGKPALMPFGGSPFMEAPLLLWEDDSRSLAIWLEDATMRPFYGMVKRDRDGVSLGMELLTLMPFEDKTAVETPVFKINLFAGNWKHAATPFRNWYQKQFQPEIAVRDGVAWAGGIKNIIDIYMQAPPNQVFESIAKYFPSTSVMFQTWNARAPGFDRELPDWTPRAGYVDGVARVHQFGFKTMAYVNTYCVNYQSPVWKRDQLEKFVLTRKNSAQKYQGKSEAAADVISEKLIGTVDYATGADQFANIEPGKLIYTDPLSKAWREYHVRQMVEWNSTTRTDANYEDTAGTANDHGNGIVDGLSAAQGAVAQMRLLQKVQPQVPMSSEYGPAPIAFATSWALNYTGAWGNESFRRYRINHQYPVTAYLYGYRQWVTSLMGTNSLSCHAMAASSDATGGLGFCSIGFFQNRTDAEIRNDFTWAGHFFRRSLVFAEKNLTPHFPDHDYPANVRCFYRGNDGVYSYCDDGGFQWLASPRGEQLYGRVTGISKVKTPLWLYDWPAQENGRIMGLDPDACYPLFPKPADAPVPALTLSGLAEGVIIREYRGSDHSAYLELHALPGGPRETTAKINNNRNFSARTVNGRSVDSDHVSGTLPLRIAYMNPVAGKLNVPIGEPREKDAGQLLGVQMLYLHSGANARRDYPVSVPGEDCMLELCFQNLQDQYPFHGYDGTVVRLLINGMKIASFDCLSGDKPDTQARRWRVPLQPYAGQNILITVLVDPKKNPNNDRQFVGIPKIIKATGQQFEEQCIDGNLTVKSVVALPEKWQGGPLEDQDGAKLIRGTGVRQSSESIAVDPQKIYRLSGKFKAATASDKGSLLFGFSSLSADGRSISPDQVNPVSRTETVLAQAAETGDTIIHVKDNSKWKSGAHLSVAFNARPDKSDLPNADLAAIAGIKDQEITLKQPLSRSYPAGTPVRQHMSGNTYLYTAASYQKVPADQWVEFKGEISGEQASGLSNNQWRRGTVRARVIIIANQPDIMFKDIRFEELE